jgi:coenzyme F420-0:L-glutamate ligase
VPDVTAGRIEILPVHGMPGLRPGDDLAGLLAAAAPWLRDRDIVVVTSKAVSKVEGRLIPAPADPAGREAERQRAVDAETVRVVASRGRTRIVQTRHGLVLASAGVDLSNVRADEISLLPVDPDASAGRLRDGLGAALGVDVAVVVTDTVGRPWRAGLVDTAIGVAGMPALVDLRGATDGHGNLLQLTEVAVADEVAAAAELGAPKLAGVPAVVVRGLSVVDDGRGSKPLVRPAADDLFRLGTAEAIELGRQRALAGAASPGALHSDTRRVVDAYDDPHPGQRALRAAFLAYLDARPDALDRSCRPGHITASALVLDPARDAVLLALHPRVGGWVQLGGHVEDGDASLAAAAAREAAEESGLAGLVVDPSPVHLDVHPITCSLGVPTRHLDIRFLALAPPGAAPVRTDELLDVRWFPADRLPAGAAPDLPELIRRARARAGLPRRGR